MLTRTHPESQSPGKQFLSAHFQGYTDHFTGKPRRFAFVSEAYERGYLSGWAMADIPQETGGYCFQDAYWQVYTQGSDDELIKRRPCQNLYTPGTWQHVAYISGVQFARYWRRK